METVLQVLALAFVFWFFLFLIVFQISDLIYFTLKIGRKYGSNKTDHKNGRDKDLRGD
jgi:hypothetical protein